MHEPGRLRSDCDSSPTADLQISDLDPRLGGADDEPGRCTVPPAAARSPTPPTPAASSDRSSDPFAPVPKSTACTQIYGGPEIADVSGTFNGKAVDTQFSRGNGCELERWKRVGFLFPGVS